jgi:hypothetical protein
MGKGAEGLRLLLFCAVSGDAMLSLGRLVALVWVAVVCFLNNPSSAQVPNYRELERQDIRSNDFCGPDAWRPGERLATILNGPFKGACERHDSCYRLNHQSRDWCDGRFKDDMFVICTMTHGVDYLTCRTRAIAYHKMVLAMGREIYNESARPAGSLANIRARKIPDLIGDDEFEVCTVVMNPSEAFQVYELRLVSNGRLVDKRPKGRVTAFNSQSRPELHVSPRSNISICLTTDWSPSWSISDLAAIVQVELWADVPSTDEVDLILVTSADVAVSHR